jgi:hypothetical protein
MVLFTKASKATVRAAVPNFDGQQRSSKGYTCTAYTVGCDRKTRQINDVDVYTEICTTGTIVCSRNKEKS